MEQTKSRVRKKSVKPCLGFQFSKADEIKIKLACISARNFMRNYGKGKRMQMVDLRHYCNTINELDYAN
jgi:hypothetical protein